MFFVAKQKSNWRLFVRNKGLGDLTRLHFSVSFKMCEICANLPKGYLQMTLHMQSWSDCRPKRHLSDLKLWVCVYLDQASILCGQKMCTRNDL